MAKVDNTIKDTPGKTIDPVCGMVGEPGREKLMSIHKGNSYWFCAEGCRKAFETNPEKYLEPKTAKKKGWFGRYLDKMARTNEKTFCSKRPRCH